MAPVATLDRQTLETLSSLNEHGLCSISEHCRKLRSIAHEPAMTKVESHLQLILEDLTELLDEIIYVHDHLFRLKRQLPIRQRILHQARLQAGHAPYAERAMLSQLDTMERALQVLQCAPLSRTAVRFLRHIETVCKALIKMRNDVADMLSELGQSSALCVLMCHHRQAN